MNQQEESANTWSHLLRLILRNQNQNIDDIMSRMILSFQFYIAIWEVTPLVAAAY